MTTKGQKQTKVRGRSKITGERRARILAILGPGLWVRSRRLHDAACPELTLIGFRHLMRWMRVDGYQLESEGGAQGRGWRLISEPKQMALAA